MRPRKIPALRLFARQGCLHFFERIQIFLQAANMVLHLRDGRSELCYGPHWAAHLTGLFQHAAHAIALKLVVIVMSDHRSQG